MSMKHFIVEPQSGSFLEPYKYTQEHSARLSKGLLAAIGAGLLASSLLAVSVVNISNTTALGSTGIATAQILQRCNVKLLELHQVQATQVLNAWAPIWLTSDSNRTAQARSELCTQLISASLQSPFSKDIQTDLAFSAVLEDTKQLMLTQIADQVLADEHVAEELAPLMGLAPSDVTHYFKSVKNGSPLERAGPTPEAGPYFNI